MKNMQMRVSLQVLIMASAVAITGGCSDRRELPDLAAISDVNEMKRAFYDALEPVVTEQNLRILQQRAELEAIASTLSDKGSLSWWQRYQLGQLADEYELSQDDAAAGEMIAILLTRVDIVPADLALAQAAKESGWGRSRFATEVNNLFGQWCYVEGCGVIPAQRPADARHEVEAFSSVTESIRRYMNNLNTHERYETLRALRLQRRKNSADLTGESLAPGLIGYSERGADYVDEIIAMIRRNQHLMPEANRSS